MKKKREWNKIKFTPTQMLVLGAIAVIIIGGILLKLPISNQDGKEISWTDSFFMSTSAVCVTGLSTIVVAEQFSTFGKIVLLALIQIGGLGLMSFITLLLIAIGRKINLSERLIIKESLNQDNFKGLIKLILNIFKYTFVFEMIGAIFLSMRFIPQFGIVKGISYSIFHSISAFCNAGIDIIGNSSFINYSNDFIINITLMSLIIIGGLGFTVWLDLKNSIVSAIKQKLDIKRIWRELSVYSKLVLLTTVGLLITGTFIFFALENDNTAVMGTSGFKGKLMKSAFYSTTLRTAGFSTIPLNELTTASKFMSLMFMFIGGSSASTAGGIKTVTFAIILLMTMDFAIGKNETIIYNRKISTKLMKRAIVIFSISIFIVMFATVALLITEDLTLEQKYDVEYIQKYTLSFMDILYEVFSAFGTVGLSLGITSIISLTGKIILMLLMLAGRLGPVTISMALFESHIDKKKSSLEYPECDLIIG